MKIKLAVREDITTMIELTNMVYEYDGDQKVDGDILLKNISKLVDMRGVVVGERDGKIIGGIGGYRCPCLFNSDIFFVVMFFYIRPQYRRYTREFLHYLEWFMKNQVDKLIFSVPTVSSNGDDLKKIRFMRMLGYSSLETHMVKRIDIR